MTKFDDFLNEQLKDEEVKKEYDVLDEEFKKVQEEMMLERCQILSLIINLESSNLNLLSDNFDLNK